MLKSLGIDILQGGMDAKVDNSLDFFPDRLMKKVPSFAKEKKSKEMCMSLVGATSMPLIIFLDFSLSEAWDKRITYSNFPPSKPNFNWGKQGCILYPS